LVRSSSPPSPTTQSCANGDFPVQCESPRTGGDLCTHFVSAICRLNCRDRFGAFVSAAKSAFPDGGDWRTLTLSSLISTMIKRNDRPFRQACRRATRRPLIMRQARLRRIAELEEAAFSALRSRGLSRSNSLPSSNSSSI
jgi:hypothetical protein